jgi:hypothetical protein
VCPRLVNSSPCPRGYCTCNQAGLLTPGSTYLLRLPNIAISGVCAVFVPGYSGGPVPDLHRIPHSSTLVEPDLLSDSSGTIINFFLTVNANFVTTYGGSDVI